MLKRFAVVFALTVPFTALSTNAVPAHAAITPVAYCTQQIVQNVLTAPNVYGYCDNLTDSQVSAASNAALVILNG